ncbi:GntR family transcriptional regulator [Cryobacterium arcticum]|nr:GntR family transcriptional regulator [Cryobacterium arcticum]
MSFTHNELRAVEFQRQRLLSQPTLHTSSRRTYEQLRASIRVGLTDPDTQFRELTISQEFGASRNSVRVALAMLAADGLITRGPRRGTILTKQIIDFPVDRVLPRYFDIDPETATHGMVVLDLESAVLTTPALIAELLDTDADRIASYEQMAIFDGEPVYVRSGVSPITYDADQYFARLVACNAAVAAITDASLAAPVGSEPPADGIEMEMVFELLFGVPFGHCRSRVEVVPADEHLSKLLGIDQGSPLLQRQQVNYDTSGIAREFSFTHYRGDRATLTSQRTYAKAAE